MNLFAISARAGLATMACAWLAGCADPPTMMHAVELLRTTPASEALKAEGLDLTVSKTRTWRITSSDGRPAGVVVTSTTPTQAHHAQWEFTEADGRSEFRAVDKTGNVVMTASIEPRDKALTLFDPPLMLMPAELSPGEARQQEVSMRVVDMNNVSRQREAGRATRTIQYVDDCVIRTELGEFTVARLKSRFEATLRFARASTDQTWLVAPGLGIIVDETNERITILGAVTRENQRTLVLVQPLAPAPESP